jgi:hypothetical protein
MNQLLVYQLLRQVQMFLYNKHELPQAHVNYFTPNNAVHNHLKYDT